MPRETNEEFRPNCVSARIDNDNRGGGLGGVAGGDQGRHGQKLDGEIKLKVGTLPFFSPPMRWTFSLKSDLASVTLLNSSTRVRSRTHTHPHAPTHSHAPKQTPERAAVCVNGTINAPLYPHTEPQTLHTGNSSRTCVWCCGFLLQSKYLYRCVFTCVCVNDHLKDRARECMRGSEGSWTMGDEGGVRIFVCRYINCVKYA